MSEISEEESQQQDDAKERAAAYLQLCTTQAMTEEEIQDTISRHRVRNAELQRVLITKGVSLSQERPVDVHFWASDQIDAARLARDLYRRGYLVTVIARAAKGPDGERWNVEAGANMAPQKVLNDDFTEDLVRLAGILRFCLRWLGHGILKG